MLIEALQLVLTAKIDFDPPRRAFADDADAGAEGELQAIFRGARVGIDFARRRGHRRRRFAANERLGAMGEPPANTLIPVYTTGTQTISGDKEFTGDIEFSGDLSLSPADGVLDASNLEELTSSLEGGLFEPQKTPEQLATLERLETMLALV